MGGVGHVALGVILLVSLSSSIQTAKGECAPRQMLREIAAYLNENAQAEDLVVVAPSGPTLLGVAYYSTPGLRFAAVPSNRVAETVQQAHAANADVWLVRQRLGGSDVKPSNSAFQSEFKGVTASPVVRFAGVDVVHLRRLGSDD